jgi:hypothetical protein
VRSPRVAAIVRAIKIISREELARRLANQTGLFDLTTLSDGELRWLSDEFELLPGAEPSKVAEEGSYRRSEPETEQLTLNPGSGDQAVSQSPGSGVVSKKCCLRVRILLSPRASLMEPGSNRQSSLHLRPAARRLRNAVHIRHDRDSVSITGLVYRLWTTRLVAFRKDGRQARRPSHRH